MPRNAQLSDAHAIAPTKAASLIRIWIYLQAGCDRSAHETVLRSVLLEQRFEIGAHVGERAASFSDTPNFFQINLPLPPRITQGFNGHVETDFIAAPKTVHNSARGSRDFDRHAINQVAFDPKGQPIAIDNIATLAD